MSSDSDSNDDEKFAAQGSTVRRNWDESFEALIAFKKKFGHVLVPSSYAEDSALGHWVRKQRRNEANNQLSSPKRDKLDSIGFAWKLRGDQATASEKPEPALRKRNWMESYRALIAYKRKHGHCNVPRRNPGDFALGQWVNKQRSRDLTRRQRDKLQAIGFDFECKRDKNQRSWDEKFERLKAYKKKHRDVNVPYHYSGDPGLGPWVSEQRRLYDQLSQERVDKLESLGFNGSADGSGEDQAKAGSPREIASLDERWAVNYKSLQKYCEVHGNCLVSRNKDKPLSYWVVRQRQLNFQQKLKPERKELLEKLNFEWYVGGIEPPEHYFDEMMGRLNEYQQEHGSVDVPSGYARGGLGGWLDSLKREAREGTLAPEKAERLLRTGFSWLEDRNSWLKTLEKVSHEIRELRRNSGRVLELPKTVENWLRIQFLLLDYDLLPPKRRTRFEALGLALNGTELSWVEYSPGDPMVGNAWLVDELAAGFDLKDAALSWTPSAKPKRFVGNKKQEQSTVAVVQDDSSYSQTPPKNIVGDAESPASSFDDDTPKEVTSETGKDESVAGRDGTTLEEDDMIASNNSEGGSKRNHNNSSRSTGDGSGGSSPQYESALEQEEEPALKKVRVETGSSS